MEHKTKIRLPIVLPCNERIISLELVLNEVILRAINTILYPIIALITTMKMLSVHLVKEDSAIDFIKPSVSLHFNSFFNIIEHIPKVIANDIPYVLNTEAQLSMGELK